MEIDVSRILTNWINLGLIIFILKYFFWDKIKGIIEERQNLIEGKINKADEDIEKAKMYLVQNERILQSAREEGKKITEEQKQKGNKIYEEIIENAKAEAVALIERANVEIERQKEKAEYEVKKEAVNLAIELSIKALEQKVDEDTHRKLIGDFISKVGI